MNKTRIVALLVIGLIIVGGGTYAFKKLFPAEPEKQAAPVYATQAVKRGDLTVNVEVSGPLNPNYGGGIMVPNNYGSGGSAGISSYVIEETYVKPGDYVKQGQALVRLSAPGLPDLIQDAADQLLDERKALASLTGLPLEQAEGVDPSKGIVLSSPIDGRIIELVAKDGLSVADGEIVARVVDDSRFQVIAKLTMGEYNQLDPEQVAMLSFPDYFNGFVQAEIIDINSNPVPESTKDLLSEQTPIDDDNFEYVYWVTLEGKNPGLIRPEMPVRIGFIDPETAAAAAVDPQKIHWLRYFSKVDRYASEERVLSQAESIITHVFVKKMQFVKAGQPLISMAGQDVQELIREKKEQIREKRSALNQLQDQEGMLLVKSPIEGIVADFNRKAGETAQPGEWLGSIFQASDMRLWSQVDDMDVLLVKQGAECDITVDALPGKKYPGRVEMVATSGKDDKGIARFDVSIIVEGGPDFRPGMQATAHINAGSAQGVLLIPLEAVFQEDGQNKVEILQPDGSPKVVAVELGLMSDRQVEVRSGLAEGDLVITGSSADLLPSQTIQTEGLLPEGDPGGEEPTPPGEEKGETGAILP